MTENNQKSKLSFLQYVNTVILTAIGIIAALIFTTISDVRKNQGEFSKDIIRITTIQETNRDNIEKLDVRVKALELNYVTTLKDWIDANYIRKPQR